MKRLETIAIILAAGGSRRLGHPKQLIELSSGETLIAHTVRCFTSLGVTAVVVTGAKRKQVEKELQKVPCIMVYNPCWEEGMASSIRCGISEAKRLGVMRAILSVVDQPLLSADVVEALLHASKQHPGHIVTCEYSNGVQGPPAVFPHDYFAMLMELEGDRGARSVVEGEEVFTVQFDGGEVDVDVENDI